MLTALPIFADNEIYVNQSGNTASIDLEQLGSSNLIGGTSAIAGTSNTFDLKVAENSDSSYLDLDWIILGDSNQFDFDIDYANAINYVDVNGSSNTVNFTGSGYSGNTSSDSGYFYMDLDGSSNTFNIIQSSTLARDWLKIETTTSNSNICITQNDGGTATGC